MIHSEVKRLEQMIKELGKSTSQLSKELGFSASYLGKCINRAQKGVPIPKTVLAKLSEKYPVYWVATGQKPVHSRIIKPEKLAAEKYIELPYLSASARADSKLPSLSAPTEANFVEMIHEQNHGLTETYRVPLRNVAPYNKGLIVVAVYGDSMEPSLGEGDHVLGRVVDQNAWEELEEAIYVVAFTDFLVIKRIQSNDLRARGQVLLSSDNTETGGTITIQQQDIRTIWRAVKL